MDGIQYLDLGAKILLAGEIPASVEDNPRDGVWLVARYARSVDELIDAGNDRLSRAAAGSAHGMTSLRDRNSLDVVIVVHAEDILGMDAG